MRFCGIGWEKQTLEVCISDDVFLKNYRDQKIHVKIYKY